MVPFECLHELYKNLSFRLFARSDLWVSRTVIPLGKFLHVKLTILIEIESLKSTFHQTSSKLAHFSNDDPQEFIEVNLSTLINVHRFEETLNILWVNINSEIAAAFLKLHKV